MFGSYCFLVYFYIIIKNKKTKDMKTIYLRIKRSGNAEFSNKANATLKFTTKKAFKKWWNENVRSYYAVKIIKATYSRSQTYFDSMDFEGAYKFSQI